MNASPKTPLGNGTPGHGDVFVYVGTYTRRGSEGIYVFHYDPASGALSPLSTATGIQNPSFLAIDPQRRYLYAVNEAGGGAVSAFAIDPATGGLTPLNRQSSHGDGPCHLTVDPTGQYVLAANYSSGSVCVLPIGEGGALGEATNHIQHEGSSVNPRRQRGPHAHSINLDPAGRYAFVPDLGLDKIMIYQLDLDQGVLRPNDEPWVAVHPGAGPRHFAFHPNGQYAYVINEIDSTVTAFAYDPERGRLSELGVVSTLPAGFQDTSWCADLHVAPSGKFLYGSNRGHDSIVIYAIDQDTGMLTLVGFEPTQGKTPRNFGIDPSGTFLLAANQDTDTIVAFRIDADSGTLSPTGHVTSVPAPVCVLWRS